MSYVPHEDQKMSDKELEQHRERFRESLDVLGEYVQNNPDLLEKMKKEQEQQ